MSKLSFVRSYVEYQPPTFKSEDHYLTMEGYPLGTTCWYVRVVLNGLITFCCAETPVLAVKAALRHLREQDVTDVRRRFVARPTLGRRKLNRIGRRLLKLAGTRRADHT